MSIKELNILFVASDPGGSRALLALVNKFNKNNFKVLVVANGYLHYECADNIPRVTVGDVSTFEKFSNAVKKENIELVYFGTGVQDRLPLDVAHYAKLMNVPTIAVLDNWMNYRERLISDNYGLVLPTIYAVMDEHARTGAIDEGIPENIVCVTGHPALEGFEKRATCFSSKRRGGSLSNSVIKSILFVSEPVEDDHGSSKDNPDYRGYTEKTILENLSSNLQKYSKEITINLLCHPRENRNNLSKYWREIKGGLVGDVLNVSNGKDALFYADATIGMTSILLYKSWLLGKPTLSFQPGLIRADLNIFDARDGCDTVISCETSQVDLDHWVKKTISSDSSVYRTELSNHSNSTNILTGITNELLDKTTIV